MGFEGRSRADRIDSNPMLIEETPILASLESPAILGK